MKISTSTDKLTKYYGDEVAIKKFAQAGFQALDFGMFYPVDDWRFQLSEDEFIKYFSSLKTAALQNGIEIGQTHSPMVNYIYTGDEVPGNIYLDAQIKAIHATALLGAPYVIIHPVIPPQCLDDCYKEEAQEINRKYYGKLRPFAEEYGVKIAVENMWYWDAEHVIHPTCCSSAEDMKAYVDMMGRDRFTTCLDIGHGILTGYRPEDMIASLGDYLEVLHIHDNDGIHDSHLAPRMGVIDWPAVCLALKKIQYKGNFNFEADSFYGIYGPRLYEDTTRFLCRIGQDFVDQYDL